MSLRTCLLANLMEAFSKLGFSLSRWLYLVPNWQELTNTLRFLKPLPQQSWYKSHSNEFKTSLSLSKRKRELWKKHWQQKEGLSRRSPHASETVEPSLPPPGKLVLLWRVSGLRLPFCQPSGLITVGISHPTLNSQGTENLSLRLYELIECKLSSKTLRDKHS